MRFHPDIEAVLAPPLSPLGGPVSAAELADFFGITANRIHALARQGIIPRTAAGHFDFRSAARAYCDSLRASQLGRPSSNPELNAEKVRLARANAEKVELANAKVRGALVPVGEVEVAWAAILRDVRAAILAVPARLGQQVGHLTPQDLQAIDRELRDALERCADDSVY
jgi:phage terminase Nu1 subunit (DNA packaging protein)